MDASFEVKYFFGPAPFRQLSCPPDHLVGPYWSRPVGISLDWRTREEVGEGQGCTRREER